jgi:hypothetical protein
LNETMETQLLYLAGSLVGVAAICGLCVALFGRGVSSLDAAGAAARVADDVPGFRPGRFALSADTRSALIEDARDGGVYIVCARGDGLVTRKLAKGFLRATSRDGAALRLKFADFTFPQARIDLADEAAARDWEARFAKLTA